MGGRRWRSTVIVAALGAVPAQPALAQSHAQIASAIRASLDAVSESTPAQVASESIVLSTTLIRAYEQSGFEPLWTDPAACADLTREVDALTGDGLNPSSYHRDALGREAYSGDARMAADLDLLRTATLLDIIHDLARGKARPPLPGIGAEFAHAPKEIDAATLRSIIGSGRIHEEVARFRPTHFVYRGLQQGLARLRVIASHGGWGTIPNGPALFRDSADVRIPMLRRRLSTEGYAAADSGVSAEFDAPLERAVLSFQHHHGLNEDGVVGVRTRAGLNVSVEARIDQVRVNLERARWLGDELPPRFVVVNIAGAKVYVVDGSQIMFEARAIVGRMYTKTPLFSATLRTIELDPTWTVPSGIVKEILSEIRRDQDYLVRAHMLVFDERGTPVDPSSIDFANVRAETFPYIFRQEPGSTNPLGRIKLLFPNGYNVYLHDTPERSLFAHEQRTFSHGCIRVADPFGLAELVLGQPSLWSRFALERATGTDTTRVLPVPKPMPVLVFYWTASADERGELHFYRDVYGRDGAILRLIGPSRRPTSLGSETNLSQGELPTGSGRLGADGIELRQVRRKANAARECDLQTQ